MFIPRAPLLNFAALRAFYFPILRGQVTQILGCCQLIFGSLDLLFSNKNHTSSLIFIHRRHTFARRNLQLLTGRRFGAGTSNHSQGGRHG